MRILVVEDETELLSLVSRALREEGYAVDEASDGDDGLFKALHWEYDAILLDVMLPKIDGWSLLRELRRKKQTPVLLLTARDGLKDRVQGLDFGADDYLVKPFHLSELLARLRAIIRRASGIAASTIVLGPVSIDTVKRSVSLENVEVVLTGREYALVEFLAHRRGRIVTKTEIYDHLYDENDVTLSNLIEVHISNIRRKLGKEFITTRRGLGYMVEAPD